MKKAYLKWSECNFTWTGNDYTWSEVFLLAKVGGLVSGHPKPTWKQIQEKLSEQEKNTFVGLVCKVNGLEHRETKQTKNLYITTNRIKRTLNEVKVTVKLND